MADASRVGYRTNGLSSALQLHHLSSRVGQTDGIALPGVHQRRMPMDHAIADSHATVTISHSGVQESQDPPKRAMSRWSPPRTPCPILARGGVRDARAAYVHSVTLAAVDTSLMHTPGSGPTSLVDEASRTSERARNPKTGVPSNASSLRHTVRQITPAGVLQVTLTAPAQLAERRSRTDRHRSTSRA